MFDERGTIRGYLIANRNKGFDELAQDLTKELHREVTKEEVKEAWNDAKLGFKYVPRTLVRVTPLSHSEPRRFALSRLLLGKWKRCRTYRLEDDVVLFLDPTTPRVIPAGFETDFGSVPVWFRFVADKDDPAFLFAFLNHDLDYMLRWVSRRMADARLLFLSKECGASFLQRVLVYAGVRAGGWLPWYGKTKERESERQRAIELVTKASAQYRSENVSKLQAIAKRYV